MERTMFEIKCTDCGQIATVPFKPTAGKPVYCRTCFSKHAVKQPDRANDNCFNPKQAWARRRDVQTKKEDIHPNVARWSYNVQNK